MKFFVLVVITVCAVMGWATALFAIGCYALVAILGELHMSRLVVKDIAEFLLRPLDEPQAPTREEQARQAREILNRIARESVTYPPRVQH